MRHIKQAAQFDAGQSRINIQHAEPFNSRRSLLRIARQQFFLAEFWCSHHLFAVRETVKEHEIPQEGQKEQERPVGTMNLAVGK